jgi:glycosyltransferase involved in cell wall biosynthesis
MTDDAGNISLSVVVPAHNSSDVIVSSIERLAARLSDREAEVIIVENGSTDGTYELCRLLMDELPAKHPRLRLIRSDKGMGNALRAGSEASHGEYILLTADDLPFGFDDLDAYDQLREAPAARPLVMIGSKAHRDSQVERNALRRTLTFGFGILRRLILGMKTGDPQGTVIIKGDLLRTIAPTLREDGFLFTTELIYRVERMGLRPVEVAVKLSADHADHPSRVSPSDVLSMAVGLLRVRAGDRLTSSERHPPASSQEATSADIAEASKDSRRGWPNRDDHAQ